MVTAHSAAIQGVLDLGDANNPIFLLSKKLNVVSGVVGSNHRLH
jgi:hypothetical protein